MKYLKAKNKLEAIKNFRWFLLSSVMASIFMIGFSVFLHIIEGENSIVPISIFLSSTFGLWVIVLFECLKTLKRNPRFIKKWEERQIVKYLKKRKQ